jgi:hypothetical protein
VPKAGFDRHTRIDLQYLATSNAGNPRRSTARSTLFEVPPAERSAGLGDYRHDTSDDIGSQSGSRDCSAEADAEDAHAEATQKAESPRQGRGRRHRPSGNRRRNKLAVLEVMHMRSRPIECFSWPAALVEPRTPSETEPKLGCALLAAKLAEPLRNDRFFTQQPHQGNRQSSLASIVGIQVLL